MPQSNPTDKAAHCPNLIIDLGAVLFAIDIPASLRAFAKYATADSPPVSPEILSCPPFTEFEKGILSPAGFREALRSSFALSAMDAELDAAWNALLIGVIPGRVTLMEQLAKARNIVLLSNTNQLHFDALEKECRPLFERFRSTYFSFNMGMRKPDAEIFEYVLAREGWSAGDTALIDDSKVNVQGAKAAGLETLLYKGEEDWGVWFPALG